MDYPKVRDGNKRVFNPEETTLKIACCHCGLVHYHSYKIIGNGIELTIFMDEEETRQLREQNYGKLQYCSKSEWIMRKKDEDN